MSGDRLDQIEAHLHKARRPWPDHPLSDTVVRQYLDDVPWLVEQVRQQDEVIERVRAPHVKDEHIRCGATNEVPHQHGAERKPYPIRPVACTLPLGHEGPHKDAICCWNFQQFEGATGQKSMEWMDCSTCAHCHQHWPCDTIAALDGER